MSGAGPRKDVREEVVVIGAGLMGAASTMALSRRGHRPLTLEARRPGHREGSSHGSSRIFRHSYSEPHYVEMARRAGELWRDLELLGSRRLLTITGGLDHGDRHHVAALYAAQRAGGVECELLQPDVAADRWPGLRFAGEGLWTPAAGIIDPELAVAEMLRLAEARGARVRYETPVLDVEPLAGGVRIRTVAQTVVAETAVVAAGPWLPALLDGVVALPPLTVTQQQVFHFAPAEPFGEPVPPAAAWPVILHQDEDLDVYALPGGRDGGVPGNVKVALHDPGPETTPEGRDGRIDEAGKEAVIDYVRRWCPGLRPQPVAAFTCLYTMTADEDFIIASAGPLIVCSACSGHGAKFAPLIGEWVADLAEGRGLPYDRFGLTDRPRL